MKSIASLIYLITSLFSMVYHDVKEQSLEMFYDTTAERYHHVFGKNQEHFSDEIVRFLSSKHNANYQHALDLGCGTGILTKRIKRISDQCTGIDFSSGMIQKAKKDNDPINYVIGNILDLPFKKEFDLITCLGVISHVMPEDFDTFVSEIDRVSKKRSHVVIGITPLPWRLFFLRKNPLNPSWIDKRISQMYNQLQSTLGKSERRGLYQEQNFIDAFSKYGFAVTIHEINGLVLIYAVR